MRTDTSPLLEGIRAHLAALVPTHEVVVDDATTAARQIIIETAGSPTREAFTMGEDTFGHLTIQITCVDTTRNGARKTGDRVRALLAGQTARGAWAHPIVVPGATLDRPTGQGDGFIQGGGTDGLPAQWVERFRLRWQ